MRHAHAGSVHHVKVSLVNRHILQTDTTRYRQSQNLLVDLMCSDAVESRRRSITPTVKRLVEPTQEMGAACLAEPALLIWKSVLKARIFLATLLPGTCHWPWHYTSQMVSLYTPRPATLVRFALFTPS